MAYSNVQFLNRALTQRGKPYVFGAETNPLDPSPKAFDCSELTQWADNGLGGHLVDGAQNQFEQLRAAGGEISVAEGIKTCGALLFMGALQAGQARGIHHVVISQGNGETMEAKGRAWGCNVFSATRGFNFATRIPWCTYGPVPGTITGPGGILVLKPFILRKGSTGAAVKFGQAMLNIMAKVDGAKKIVEDGDFGDQTKASVAHFEKWAAGMQGLAAHGKPIPPADRITVNSELGGPEQSALAFWVPKVLAGAG